MALSDKQMADARSEYSPSLLGGATQSFSGWEPKKLWRARAEGASEECAWTEGFDSRSDGRSLIATDLDDDGDVDLLMLNRNAPRLQLFRNDGENGRAVRLRFTPASGAPDGANVLVRLDGRQEEVLLHRGFASSVPPELIRGVARETANVEVTWRSGKQQRFVVPAGHTSTLVEATGKVVSTPFLPAAPMKAAPFPSTLDTLGLPAGKPTLVTLFLAGCEPCKKEAPSLNALAKSGRYAVHGLGVAATQEDAARIGKQLGYAFPVKPLPEPAGDALSTNGQLTFPTTLQFGADGKLERVLTDSSALPK